MAISTSTTTTTAASTQPNSYVLEGGTSEYPGHNEIFELNNRNDEGTTTTTETGRGVLLSSPTDTHSAPMAANANVRKVFRNQQLFDSASTANVFLAGNFSKARIESLSQLPVRGEPDDVYHSYVQTDSTSHPAPIRESDSILLTIFIGIVVCACIATILLAFLTILGRRGLPVSSSPLNPLILGRKKASPRFEGARIERTIPKPTIIGLDYHQRKNSSASNTPHVLSRYDSMNSLTAIYSQISKPKRLCTTGSPTTMAKISKGDSDSSPFHTPVTFRSVDLLSAGDSKTSRRKETYHHKTAHSGQTPDMDIFAHITD